MQKQFPLETIIHTAAGHKEPDLVFKNAQVVNVFTKEIYRADVSVIDGVIAGIGQYDAKCTVDCTDYYLCPGFLDAHCHIESSMTLPIEFSNAVLPSGTTAVIADPHEIVNVCGAEGFQFMLDSAAHAACDIFYMLPSCVPATAFETSGAVFTPEDMKPFLNHERVLGLAEVMSFPDVIAAETKVLDKIKLFSNRPIDGHAPGLSGKALQAYAAAGISTDHEATSFDEVLEKVRAGLTVQIREGSAAHNLKAIVEGIVKYHLPTEHFLFCTDDKHLDDIRRDGHIVQNIRMAIQLGISSVDAVCMATINTANHYGLTDRGAIAPGRLADIVLLSDLETMKVESVYKSGLLVDQSIPHPGSTPIPDSILHSVLLKPVTKCDLALQVSNPADVIEMIPSQLLTNHLHETVPIENGHFKPDSVYAKLCVLERHGKNGNIAVAPLKGYGIQNGAVATSVAHDSHNIIAVGDNDADITLAINHIRDIDGGYVVVQNGQIIGSLPLRAAGLMSIAPYPEVERGTQAILEKARTLQIADGIDPFISLSFMALPVIPTLRLSDQGLIDLFTP